MVKAAGLGFETGVPAHCQGPPHSLNRRTAGYSVTMTTVDHAVSNLPYDFTGYQFK